MYVLGKATGIAKEHSMNKISIVMVVGKFKIIMRSGPKAVCPSLCHSLCRNGCIVKLFIPSDRALGLVLQAQLGDTKLRW